MKDAMERARKAAWGAITSDPVVFRDYLERPTFEEAISAFLAALRKDYAIVPRKSLEQVVYDGEHARDRDGLGYCCVSCGNYMDPQPVHSEDCDLAKLAAAMIAAYEGEG